MSDYYYLNFILDSVYFLFDIMNIVEKNAFKIFKSRKNISKCLNKIFFSILI